MRMPARGERPLCWVGSTKRDLLTFPEAVQDGIGAALSVAQFGGKYPAAKPWKGAGPVFKRNPIGAFRQRNQMWTSFDNA